MNQEQINAMSSEEFHSRLDELTIYYNTHDDIKNGAYLKDKKYWYVYYDTIQYGYVSSDENHGTHDGSCKNRITYYSDVIFQPRKGYPRTVRTDRVSNTKNGILLMYVKRLKEKQSLKIKYMENMFPEYIL